MTIIQTIILAIVEGLTEFLPVSSTGHMIIAQGLLGMYSDEFLKAFTVMIQFGAILSVVVLYFKRFFALTPTTAIHQQASNANDNWFKRLLRFYTPIIIGVLPAALVGLLMEEYIDKLLGSVLTVAIMLVVGGIFMLFIDRIFSAPGKKKVTIKNAFIVGLFQCIAMIPGVSRSMATIVGGLQQKLSRKTAAEFSFFLAVPTMLGATILKAYKLYKEFGWTIFQDHAKILIVANVVAFVVAMLAIKFFINFITRYGFKAFGYYRIIVGLATLLLMACGVSLSIS